MKECLDKTIKNFIECFSAKNYKKCESVKITSGIDNSVVFIGSTISVLKQILLKDKIHKVGNFLVQQSIRTHALKRINIPEVLEWSSYFDALGVLVTYDNLDKLVLDSFEFLHKYEGIKNTDLLVRISSLDSDLLAAVEKLDHDVNIEIDSKPESYYCHKYGLNDLGIYGRNFNIAVKDAGDGVYKDIGNIIVIESDNKKYGVEFAVGANAILMRKLGLKSSIEASIVADLITLDNPEKHKFADCVAVVANLAYEDIESLKGDRSKIYLYRKYLRSLNDYKKTMNISYDELKSLINDYLLLQYGQYNQKQVENNIRLLRR